MVKEEFWIVRDESTEEFIGRHPVKEFKDVDAVYSFYSHLPDTFTIDLEN